MKKNMFMFSGVGVESTCMKSMILYKLLAFHNLIRITINQFNYLTVPLGHRTHVNI